MTNSLNTRRRGAALHARAVFEDPESQVDLYKGTRGSIRQWNNQLRQPMLLASSDADTLGIDEPESQCQLR